MKIDHHPRGSTSQIPRYFLHFLKIFSVFELHSMREDLRDSSLKIRALNVIQGNKWPPHKDMQG